MSRFSLSRFQPRRHRTAERWAELPVAEGDLDAVLPVVVYPGRVQLGHADGQQRIGEQVVAHDVQDLAEAEGDADVEIVLLQDPLAQAAGDQPVPLQAQRHPRSRGQRQGEIPARRVVLQADPPVAVEAEAVHHQRLQQVGVLVELVGQAEGGAIVADPEVERPGLEFEEGIVDLQGRLDLVFDAVGQPRLGGEDVEGQPRLHGEDGDVLLGDGKALDVVEAQARLLHGFQLILGIVDDILPLE